jgi:hypothetical protein
MAKRRALSAGGDTIVGWDSRNARARDIEALAVVREGER